MVKEADYRLGNVELPIHQTVRATGSDLDMLDILFDLDMNFEKHIAKLEDPAIYAVKSEKFDLIVLFMFKPPKQWQDFEGQQYQIFLAPDLNWMIHYFVDLRMRASGKPFDYKNLNLIIGFLERFQPTTIKTTLKK